ncbi:MAG: class I SAM-dependent methyltransferase [Acidobacteria bacterium]|nr:class I SAM-dependent methyltransferase [Acidobacteriota bacterium]
MTLSRVLGDPRVVTRGAERSCPACESRRVRQLGSKGVYVMSACRSCGTVFTLAGSADELKPLYDHYYDAARFATPRVVASSLATLVGSAEPYRHTGRWLDIGFGEGSLLELVQQHAWMPYGTEVSPRVLDMGSARGWIVTSNPEADARFGAASFDVISMIELVEHVPDPARVLQNAARWLRPGGLLYLTTPNAGSLNRRLLGLGWSIFSPPEHLTIWSASGLRVALTRAGFRVIRMRAEGFNPFEIVARTRSINGREAEVDRNQTGLRLNQALSSSRIGRVAKRAINSGLTVFGVGDGLKAWAIRAAGAPGTS